MPTYLRQKTTGDMYIFTSIMAKRSDMEIVEISDLSKPAEPEAVEAPAKKSRKKAEPVAVEVTHEPVAEPVVDEPMAAQVEATLESIFGGEVDE